MKDKEEFDFNKVNWYKAGLITIIISVCIMFFFLGYIRGYNTAYHEQKDYYENKIERLCVCRNEDLGAFRTVDLAQIDWIVVVNSTKE